jgi:membrane protein
VLSVFPGLIALVALLGVLGQYPETFNAILKIIAGFAPPKTVHSVAGPVRKIITHKGGAGALLGVGTAGAIWGASGYMGTFSWASNVIWEARRGRSWYRQWPLNFAVTIIAVVAVTGVISALVLTGPVARSVGDELGIGSTTLKIWTIAKWPGVVVVVTLMISVLYYIAPNVKPPRWHWLTPGASFAILAWAITTALLGVYIAHFSDYDKTYGTLGAIVSFLIWVWLTNITMLLGIELDSEIERERQLAADPSDPGARIKLPLRQN